MRQQEKEKKKKMEEKKKIKLLLPIRPSVRPSNLGSQSRLDSGKKVRRRKQNYSGGHEIECD
jgi:hypothetical protein